MRIYKHMKRPNEAADPSIYLLSSVIGLLLPGPKLTKHTLITDIV
jgi:hypothetical protein